jgi:hypothetical protein
VVIKYGVYIRRCSQVGRNKVAYPVLRRGVIGSSVYMFKEKAGGEPIAPKEKKCEKR